MQQSKKKSIVHERLLEEKLCQPTLSLSPAAAAALVSELGLFFLWLLSSTVTNSPDSAPDSAPAQPLFAANKEKNET